jgi:hypothetical protein
MYTRFTRSIDTLDFEQKGSQVPSCSPLTISVETIMSHGKERHEKSIFLATIRLGLRLGLAWAWRVRSSKQADKPSWQTQNKPNIGNLCQNSPENANQP